ncbi:transcription termination factor 5, mitochondrial isoform X2 [Athalia rosae]|uniref:transcription termination factor 5, mitochondrial isoform X2 n=1 Tax=Athalia rosae TaxID=37344 RepID=UPI0020333F29|nr:transcription termination factor 5, mitochondrial isoform X2 [Athalia rosae]
MDHYVPIAQTSCHPSECVLCQCHYWEQGFSSDHILSNPVLMTIEPSELKERYLFFKEAGCSIILPEMIANFKRYLTMTLGEMKQNNLLPKEIDVTKNIWNNFDEKIHDPPTEPVTDNSTLLAIRTRCLRHYMKAKLGATEEELDPIFGGKRTISYRSCASIKSTLNLLINTIGFSGEKLKKHRQIFYIDVFGIESILKDVKKVGDIDTKTFLLRNFRLLKKCSKLRDTTKVLNEFRIPNIAIEKCPSIFHFLPETVRSRLIEIPTIPELFGHWHNPRILFLVCYLPRAKRRIEQLKELNVTCASLALLISGDAAFRRYTEEGIDRPKGADLLTLLHYELNTDRKIIRDVLRKHDAWCQIPFIYAQETLFYLKKIGFTNEEIWKNIHIVLYRKTIVQKELEKIDSKLSNRSWDLTPSRKLALSLYHIEKPYHFSGKGVWDSPVDQPTVRSFDQGRISN